MLDSDGNQHVALWDRRPERTKACRRMKRAAFVGGVDVIKRRVESEIRAACRSKWMMDGVDWDISG